MAENEKCYGKWVSVKEKLPEMEITTMDGKFSQQLLTVNAVGEFNILVYCFVGGEKFWSFGYDGAGDYTEDELGEITHWMPIPKLKNK